jgi:hypothetical protein
MIFFLTSRMLFCSLRTGFVCNTIKRFEVILYLDRSKILAILIYVPDRLSI